MYRSPRTVHTVDRIAARVVGGLVAVTIAATLTMASTGRAHAAPATTHTTASGALTLDSHNVVTSSVLPSCELEDGSAGPLPCSWNINAGDGNGQGLAYWVSRSGAVHYVWSSSPAVNGWRFLDVSADCVVRGHRYRCANGERGAYPMGA